MNRKFRGCDNFPFHLKGGNRQPVRKSIASLLQNPGLHEFFAKYARIFRIQMSFNFSYNRTVFSVRPLVGTKNTVLEVGIIYFRIVYHITTPDQSGEATLGSDEQRSCDRLLYQSGEPL